MLGDIFGFAQNHEKATYGLGYKLTKTRSTDNSVLNKAITTNNAKIKEKGIEWYEPDYTPSTPQQA